MQKTHHEKVSEFDRRLNQGHNPADIFHELSLTGQLPTEPLPLILQRTLVQERTCAFLSFNLPEVVPPWRNLQHVSTSMDGFDSVVAYYHSEHTLMLVNPQKESHWKKAAPLLPGSLMVVYTRARPERNPTAERQFLEKFRSICEQPSTADLLESPEDNCPPVRKTPRYVVPVTNECFHFGNVEAWRNIIEHYHEKHPGTKIHIFHRDKPVHRIGSLFKWGKVSVGDVIQFSVSGPEFRDVAKLKKYLAIGASPRYALFIKKHLNDSLNLF